MIPHDSGTEPGHSPQSCGSFSPYEPSIFPSLLKGEGGILWPHPLLTVASGALSWTAGRRFILNVFYERCPPRSRRQAAPRLCDVAWSGQPWSYPGALLAQWIPPNRSPGFPKMSCTHVMLLPGPGVLGPRCPSLVLSKAPGGVQLAGAEHWLVTSQSRGVAFWRNCWALPFCLCWFFGQFIAHHYC